MPFWLKNNNISFYKVCSKTCSTFLSGTPKSNRFDWGVPLGAPSAISRKVLFLVWIFCHTILWSRTLWWYVCLVKLICKGIPASEVLLPGPAIAQYFGQNIGLPLSTVQYFVHKLSPPLPHILVRSWVSQCSVFRSEAGPVTAPFFVRNCPQLPCTEKNLLQCAHAYCAHPKITSPCAHLYYIRNKS